MSNHHRTTEKTIKRKGNTFRTKKPCSEQEADYRNLQRLCDHSPTAMFESLPDGPLIKVNATFAKMFGFSSPQEAVSAVVSARTLYADPAARDAAISEALDKGCSITEPHFLRQDGSQFAGRLHVYTVAADTPEDPPHLAGFIEDITERKIAEKALKDSEEKYRRLVENAHQGICLLDGDFRFVFANRRTGELLGLDSETLRGRLISEFVFSEDALLFRERIRGRHPGGIPSYEQRFRRSDHSGIWCHVSATPFVDAAAQFRGSLLMITDVSAYKRTEQALKRTEQRFRTMVETALEGIWRLDAAGKVTFSNAQVAAMLGYTTDEMSNRSFLDFVAPSEHAHAKMRFRDWLRGVGARCDMCLLRKDGRVVWGIVSAGRLLDSTGLLEGVCVMVTDITQRKHAEQQLAVTERRFRELLETVDLLAAILDPQGMVVFANPCLQEVTGYEEQELIGANWFDMCVPERIRESARKIHADAVSASVIPPKFEKSICTKDGRIRDILWSNTALRDAEGRLIGTASLGQDITDRKRYEQELRLFKAIVESSNEAIAVATPEGRRIYENPAHRMLFKTDAPHGAGVYGIDGVYEPSALLDTGVMPLLQAGESREGECETGDATGRRFPVWKRVDSIRDHSGAITHIFGFMHDITSRKNDEHELREREKRFRAYFEAPLIGIAIAHVNGTCSQVNEKLCQLLGYSEEELLRMTWSEITYPQDLGRETPLLHRMMMGRIEEYAIRKRFIRKDGSLLIAEVSVRCVRTANGRIDYFIGLVEDIGERARMEDELRRNEEKYRAVFNNASVGIGIVDVEGRFLEVNPRFAKMIGYSLDEIKHLSLREVTHPDDLEASFNAIKALRSRRQEFMRLEKRCLRKDGSHFWAEITVSPIWDDHGEFDRLIGVIADISERKKARELMIQTERLTAVGSLAGGVAHNFNNLLQIILGGAQLAAINLETQDFQAVSRNLKAVSQSAMYGAGILKRLQHFARLREDEFGSESKVFDLSDVVEQSIEMTKPLWKTQTEHTGMRINTRFDLTPGAWVRGKDSDIFEVIVNLIKNAVEALPDGGDISITVKIEDSNVVCRIADSGMGIKPDDITKVFDPFWSTKGLNGTGLGLAVSFGIIKSHQGLIHVESEEGAGATFVISLPSARPNLDAPLSAVGHVSHKELTILLIDDVEAVLHLIASGLAQHKHKVIQARSGPDGIDQFCAQPVDVVISDLAMPDMNGIEVASAIKKLSEKRRAAKPPFILLTGFGQEIMDHDKLEEYGIEKILEKPVDILVLAETAKRLVMEGR